MARGVYPKFTNDHGVPEIRIGVRAFKCIGASPPQDHPHIYLAMGGQDPSILCPYCATLFRFDCGLDPFEADPPDSVFALGDDLDFPGAALNNPRRPFPRSTSWSSASAGPERSAPKSSPMQA